MAERVTSMDLVQPVALEPRSRKVEVVGEILQHQGPTREGMAIILDVQRDRLRQLPQDPDCRSLLSQVDGGQPRHGDEVLAGIAQMSREAG